ncbi:MAG: hypothetical protein Q7T18_05055 [Sedimentisphaerales bacterium]|nr:hypothetical protein [Sedimentisphaerales bacterium]
MGQKCTGHLKFLPQEIKTFLYQLSANKQIFIDAREIKDTVAIISTLEQISQKQMHGSHSIKVVHVTIRDDGKTVELVLGRDSKYSNEYWVYRPSYKFNDYIGGVTTNLFDKY